MINIISFIFFILLPTLAIFLIPTIIFFIKKNSPEHKASTTLKIVNTVVFGIISLFVLYGLIATRDVLYALIFLGFVFIYIQITWNFFNNKYLDILMIILAFCATAYYVLEYVEASSLMWECLNKGCGMEGMIIFISQILAVVMINILLIIPTIISMKYYLKKNK